MIRINTEFQNIHVGELKTIFRVLSIKLPKKVLGDNYLITCNLY